jgi:hypothetical protein
VSGYEDGFSRGPIFVGDDNSVYALQGYTPTKVSSSDLEGLIEAVADKTTLEATSYHVSWPCVLAAVLPGMDVGSGYLDQSMVAGRQLSWASIQSPSLGAINAFSKWLTGDTATGNIQQIVTTANDEVGRSSAAAH